MYKKHQQSELSIL